MDSPAVVAVVVVVVELVLFAVLLFLLAGGDTTRIGTALSAFGRSLRDRTFAERVRPLLGVAEKKETGPPKPSGAPLRLLALLQREGRLLDFLLEDIQAYPDAQIGAAVRDIHRKCRDTLKEHLVLEPVLPQAEGAAVEVPPGFDPSAVRLTGNVTGQPPFRGTLQHHGWRVKDMKVPAPPEGQNEFILMPAEVELP